MKKFLFYSMLLSIIYGCSYKKEDLAGTYIKNPSINTIDTLIIYDNNKYKQKIYFKTGEFFGVNENEWKIKNGKVNFMNLYLNYDFDLNSYTKPKNGKFDESLLMPSLLPFKKNKIIIDYDRQIFYEKIN